MICHFYFLLHLLWTKLSLFLCLTTFKCQLSRQWSKLNFRETAWVPSEQSLLILDIFVHTPLVVNSFKDDGIDNGW